MVTFDRYLLVGARWAPLWSCCRCRQVRDGSLTIRTLTGEKRKRNCRSRTILKHTWRRMTLAKPGHQDQHEKLRNLTTGEAKPVVTRCGERRREGRAARIDKAAFDDPQQPGRGATRCLRSRVTNSKMRLLSIGIRDGSTPHHPPAHSQKCKQRVEKHSDDAVHEKCQKLTHIRGPIPLERERGAC